MTDIGVHLGFDMGIRNLAYCLMRHTSDNKWSVLAWDNIDLLEGGASAQDAKGCTGCKAVKATWISETDGKKWCNACATRKRVKKTATDRPVLPTIPCKLNVKPLRECAAAAGVDGAAKMTKAALMNWVRVRYLLPWKPEKAGDASLDSIRRAMNIWLDSVLPTICCATLIRLENQPVMKGPTMKSVQIMLYTLLAHRLEREHGWGGTIEFVHAGAKTAGVVDMSGAAMSAAYRARKNAAEELTMDALKSSAAIDGAKWLEFFGGRRKKSDLADAFLMALRAAAR
jgi:hypothetical protein